MPICSRCRQEKPLAAFHKSKHHARGHRSECKTCRKNAALPTRQPFPKTLQEAVMRWVNPESTNASICWLWEGATNANGYGKLMFRQTSWLAHRASYTVFIEPIPDGLEILHKCDNRPCVNPAHLFLGTQPENIKDAVNKDRHARGIRHASSRLMDADIIRIRDLYEKGITAKELSMLYHVKQPHIYNIVNRKKWKHI